MRLPDWLSPLSLAPARTLAGRRGRHRWVASRLHVEPLEPRALLSGMSLVGNWDGHDHLYSDLWAEGDFAYLGHYGNQGGVDIIDISDPSNPTLASVFVGTGGDNEIVDLHVQDGVGFFSSNTDGSVYIVDLSDPYMPVQLARIYDDPSIEDDGLPRVHTVTVSGDYLYEVHPLFPEIRVFDISDPESPSFVRSIPSPSGFGIHEATALNGRLYTADFHNSGLTAVFDISNVGDTSTPVPLLGSVRSGSGTHTAWPIDDGQFVVVTHEVPGLGMDIFDFTDPAKPRRASQIQMPVTRATSFHQPMVVGDLLYVSSYEAGVLVYDITDPYHPVLVADYDTYPGPTGEDCECAQNPHGPFSDFDPFPVACGAWGVYPFLGSDRILVSDFDGGLFIVSLDNPPTTAVASPTSEPVNPPLLASLPGLDADKAWLHHDVLIASLAAGEEAPWIGGNSLFRDRRKKR